MIAGHRVLDGGHRIPIADGLGHIAGQESVEKAGIVCVARTDPINQLQVNLRAAGGEGSALRPFSAWRSFL